MLAGAIAIVAIAAAIASGRVAHEGRHGPVTLSATVAPWQLPQPVSAAAAVPLRGKIYLAGGLTSSGDSTGAILAIDPASGHAVPAGSLAQAGHDAAGAALSGRALVFGGGTITSTAAAQSFAPGGGAAVTGQLPAPRSCLLYTSPSPRDMRRSRMPSSA